MADRRVYALLTRHCNLSCPYCDVKNQKETFNKDKFFDELRKFDGRIILFGGEPTLYRDRLKSVVYDDQLIRSKISTITTNLMILDPEMMQIFQDIGSVGTSWSPSRFQGDEYDRWLRNIDQINGVMKIRVLCTMTHELLSMNPKDVIEIMKDWNSDTVNDVLFENLIDESVNAEYFRKADDWLCELARCWDLNFRLVNAYDVYGRCNDCSGVYTLTPDGELLPGCPHHGEFSIPIECYSCDLAEVCRPCRLQKLCSFPKKFYDLLTRSR